MLDAMRGGGQAQCTFDFGVLQPEDFPAGLTTSLTRAAQLIAAGNPQAAQATAVRVAMLGLPRDGSGSAHVVRSLLLPVQGQSVTPARAVSRATPRRMSRVRVRAWRSVPARGPGPRWRPAWAAP